MQYTKQNEEISQSVGIVLPIFGGNPPGEGGGIVREMVIFVL